MNEGALLSGTTRDGTLALVAGGAWTAVHAGELEKLLDHWLDKAADVSSVFIELGAISEFDTYGAWLIERLRREFSARGLSIEIKGLPPHEHDLLDAMSSLNKSDKPPASSQFRAAKIVHNALATVGHAVSGMANDLRSFNNMLGTLTTAFGRMITRPRSFRLTSAVHQLDRAGWRAVPIILLITFLIGAIIAQQGFFHFRKFGADIYVVDMVGILVLRELGVLLVAIMVAGRSGSAFTAELGSMKMREEIDALKTMGFDPIEVLVLPRVLVLIIALPMLTFLGSLAALYGGGLVAWIYGGMDPDIYIMRLKEAINITHFKVGLIKAPFMGAVIGILACMEGLKVKGSAASLGQQTTRSVVKSIFMVIVLDGIFAIFFAAVGM
jgi:phospholipid/cholesterol/gamma-HCH transport system permease protein